MSTKITRLCDVDDCDVVFDMDERTLSLPYEQRILCPRHRNAARGAAVHRAVETAIAPHKILKGLTCGILTNKRIGDCSAYGISSRFDSVVLVGEGIPEIFEAGPAMPAVMIGRNGGHIFAVPVDQPAGMVGPMFGGCFLYTSDSRFPMPYPIPLHDRFETQQLADSMHD